MRFCLSSIFNDLWSLKMAAPPCATISPTVRQWMFLASCLIWASPLLANLPQPLTLEQALDVAQQSHPELLAAQAQQDLATAEHMAAQSSDDLSITLETRLQYLEPAELSNFRERNDSRVDLLLEKNLYDFGYTDSLQSAARSNLEAARWLYLNQRQKHYLNVMAAFFQVLLADLEYRRDNEALAVAFVRLDKFRKKHELGQISDVELLEKESLYEKILSQRTATENRQKSTRMHLALALNHPGELPDELLAPPAPDLQAPLPPLSQIRTGVLQNNPEIKALEQKIIAAQQTLQAAKRRYGPVLKGEIGAHYYHRKTRSTSPFSAALILEMPLFNGGRDDAERARARAQLMQSEARKSALELDLNKRVTELWLAQKRLQQQARELAVRADYREMYLDRSRTLYEQEKTTDLGDAMVQISAVELALARLHYQWRLNQEQLKALSGQLFDPPPLPEDRSP